jgi:hypothetical protein
VGDYRCEDRPVDAPTQLTWGKANRGCVGEGQGRGGGQGGGGRGRQRKTSEVVGESVQPPAPRARACGQRRASGAPSGRARRRRRPAPSAAAGPAGRPGQAGPRGRCREGRGAPGWAGGPAPAGGRRTGGPRGGIGAAGRRAGGGGLSVSPTVGCRRLRLRRGSPQGRSLHSGAPAPPAHQPIVDVADPNLGHGRVRMRRQRAQRGRAGDAERAPVVLDARRHARARAAGRLPAGGDASEGAPRGRRRGAAATG